MSNYHMGMDGFVWFTAVVEDRNDPAKLGRVRIRCLGLHTEDKLEIPTESLPWAHVMHTIHDPSMQGMGTTPSFLVEGTWVVGFFRDATEMQQPVVMGTLPGYNQLPDGIGENTSPEALAQYRRDQSNVGFADPNGKYPQYPNESSGHTLGESDVNRLARGDGNYVHRILEEKQLVSEEFSEIETAQSGNFSMPYENTTNFTRYPYNHVFESESGHVREYDDTSGQERIQEYHRVGTFYEIDGGGNRVVHVVGENYEFIAGNNYVNVKGDVKLTIDGNAETYVKEDYNIRCKNLNIEVEENFDTFVKGNTTQFYGDPSLDVENQPIFQTTALGAVSQRYDTSMDFVFTKDVTYTYGAKLSLAVTGAVTEVYGSTIDRSILGAQTDIHAAAYNINSTGGGVNINSVDELKLFSTEVDLKASSGITLDASDVNINSGGSGDLAARKGDTADQGDDPAGISGSDGSNVIETGSATVKIGSADPGVGTPSIEASTLVLTEVPEEDVPLDERVDTQGPDNTEGAGTGGNNPPPEGGGHAIPAIPIRPTREEIRNQVDSAGIETTDLSVAQQIEAQKAITKTIGDIYKEKRGTEEGNKLVNEEADFSTFETGERVPPVTTGSEVTNQNQYRTYLGVPTVGKVSGDVFDESELTDDIRSRNPSAFFPSNYRVVQLRGEPRLKIRTNRGILMTNMKRKILSIAEQAAFDVGKQLLIHSAYRTPASNTNARGVKNSYHMKGQAMDIGYGNMTIKEQRIFVESIFKNGAKCCGYYSKGFIHFDDGRNRYWIYPPRHLQDIHKKYKIAPFKNG